MQCTVCYEPFNIAERRPKIVPCGHTFCLQCLKSFRVNECPSCRTMFPISPEDLIDNFLALEESADLKFVQRSLWCETCNDAPQSECVQCHDVLSSRMAQLRLESTLDVALDEEEMILHDGERKANERVRFGVEDAVEALRADTARSEDFVKKDRGGQRRQSVGGGLGSSTGVKTTKSLIKASEARTAATVDNLSILDATEAEIKVKCGSGSWRSFSLDLTKECQEMHKMVLFGAYMLARLRPPCVRLNTTHEITASVSATRGGTEVSSLPDICIEFDEAPTDRLAEQWARGWKLYSICKCCLESCHHSQHFTPQPIGTGGPRVERGAVCVGRANGRYYFIMCDDMASKFLLPLTASFKVVGRVTRNLSSLEDAVKSIRGGGGVGMVHIKPKRVQ